MKPLRYRSTNAWIRLSLALLTPLLVEAADVGINSIALQSNGLAITWTNSDANYSYTLQERTSLNPRAWSNVRTRYRWPSVTKKWTVPEGTELGATRFYRVVAQPIAAPERGKVLTTELLRTATVNDVQALLINEGFPTTDVRYEVKYYKVIYETVDPFGLPIIASGGLFVPQGVGTPMPLYSYQHGTEIYKPWAPSQNDSFHFPGALLYASAGYVTLLPDYLGLGESPGLHPYLHAKTEATAVVDMLRAVRTFCADNGISLNSQLFLAGYSQGGHATAAAHREIEMHHTNEFSVTASAPMAGSYDMSGSLDHVLNNTDYPVPLFVIYALAAWLPIYDLADTLEELMAYPYDLILVPRLTGSWKWDEVNTMMAPNLQSALDPEFRDALLNNPEHPFRLAVADNALLDWAPIAPTRLYHCAGDEIVPYENSVKAQQAYTDNGACCVSVVDPASPAEWSHSDCFHPSLLAAKAWFDSLKR